jgi:DNA mismatch repair protein MutS2
MDAHALEVLEFAKIKDQLQTHVTSNLGADLVDNLKPKQDIDYIKQRQQEVTQAKKILIREKTPPFGGIRDIRKSLSQVKKGGSLTGKELLDIANTLSTAAQLRNYLLNLEDKEDEYKQIKQIAGQIDNFNRLERKITKAIDNQGEVKDSASSKLNDLRRKIRNTSSQIKDKLNSILNSNQYQSYIQESVVTIREDRYVIPVKAANQNDFPGIVHDKSASGQTVFIEPMPVVKLNNKLQQLITEEEREVERILQELSQAVKGKLPEIKETIKVLAMLDFIFAKAKYSLKLEGSEPLLNSKGKVDLIKARHPLLTGEVVPIDVELGKEFNTLVITGPNTGGKTVSLKTVGLLTLMAQSGLHIPALSGSEIGIYKQVFADIGDEQSIEQNLSTFSSHMKQIIKIVEEADPDSLVLLDEIGAGTDPVEGSALARALLDHLHNRGARTVATTHYSQLKSYAYNTAGVENASVEFDVETLKPTYKLRLGLPGRSNAFQIAGRLGLDEEIIDQASNYLDQSDLELDDMIKQIEDDKQEYQQKREAAEENRREAEELKEEYETKLDKLKKQKERELKEAYREANKIIKRAQNKADEIIDELKERDRLSDKEIEAARSELREERKGIKQEKQQLAEQQKEKREIPELEEGDKVKLIDLNQTGKVIDLYPSKEEALVQAGMMKVTTDLRDLKKVAGGQDETKSVKKTTNAQQVASSKTQNVSPKVDLRGLRAIEARDKLDKYLDDVLLTNLNQVEIVHGKGTGALRQVVQEVLDNYRGIEDYRLGKPKEGGTGVTIASLD